MADEKYLLKRGRVWFFRMAIPTDLHGRFGFTESGNPVTRIVETLGTDSHSAAQKLRWAKRDQWEQAFERARSNVPLTVAEIDVEARRVYEVTLQALELKRAWATPEAAPDGEAQDSEEIAGLRANQWQLEEALQGADWASAGHEITAISKRIGAPIEASSKTYALLGEAILNARHSAIVGRMAALEGKATEAPDTFVAGGIDTVTLQPVAVPSRPKRKAGFGGHGLRVSEAAAKFVDEMQRDPDAALTEQTRGQHEAVFRLFRDFTGDDFLAAVTRRTAAEFVDKIAALHPHWGRSSATKELSLQQLLELPSKGDEQLSNQTINRYVSSLAGLFKWARKRGHFDEANPFAEQSREKPRKGSVGWLPFTIEELNTLFAAPQFTDISRAERVRPKRHDVESALRWVPLIALFSGMRLGEICQLDRDDLRQDGKVWYFNVAEEGEGQNVKTVAGIRKVPVHSRLVRCGLLDYRKALPAGQLFPGLKPGGPDNKLGWYFTRRFTEFRRGVGVGRPRVAFHSFRKNVSTALDNAGVPQADVAALIGHERGFTFDTYSKGLELARLQGIIEKIEYPGLALKGLSVPVRS